MRALWAALALVALASCDQPQAGQSQNTEAVSSIDGGADQSPLDQLSPSARKAFAGNGKIGGPIASISIPITPEEQADAISCNEPGCWHRFAKDAIKRFPEIAKVPFRPDPETAEANKDSGGSFRDDFIVGLYYAELIKLADGRTLFQLITECGDRVDPTTAGQQDVSATDGDAPRIAIQTFPKFRLSDGSVDDLNVIFDRRGEKITARSPLFSSDVLVNKNYMQDHGLECVK